MAHTLSKVAVGVRGSAGRGCDGLRGLAGLQMQTGFILTR